MYRDAELWASLKQGQTASEGPSSTTWWDMSCWSSHSTDGDTETQRGWWLATWQSWDAQLCLVHSRAQHFAMTPACHKADSSESVCPVPSPALPCHAAYHLPPGWMKGSSWTEGPRWEGPSRWGCILHQGTEADKEEKGWSRDRLRPSWTSYFLFCDMELTPVKEEAGGNTIRQGETLTARQMSQCLSQTITAFRTKTAL